jgi:penicillin-binding protein 1B
MQADMPGSYSVSGPGIELHTRPFSFWDGAEPAGRYRILVEEHGVSRLQDAAGNDVPLLRLEPRLFGSVAPTRHEDRQLLRLEDAPPHLVEALLAIEDRRFFEHFGIDLRGLTRAFAANLMARRVVQGGSTLTQQLVKNFYLSAERTLVRKLREMAMAVLLEWHYEKGEILEAYLNEVFLGQQGNRAIHGFGLASLYWFGRPVTELNLPEAALLAGMVKGPSYYDPRRHPARALERRNVVLREMRELNRIDEKTLAQALRAPLGVGAAGIPAAGAQPAFLDLVRAQLRGDYHEEDLKREGLRIFATLDPVTQQAAEDAVQAALPRLEAARKLPGGTLEAAVAVVRADNAEVLAVVGGRERRFAGFNRALDGARPIGSLVKPAVYLAALEEPARYTLASRLDDAPLTVTQRGAPDWTPENYDQRSHGQVTMVQALAQSYNLATARLGLELGVPRVVQALKRLGVVRELKPLPSLLLGAFELSPIEVAQMYATFANRGFRAPLRAIHAVQTRTDAPLTRYALAIEQTVATEPATLIDFALKEVVRSGTARALSGEFPSDWPIAGKTGTTDDYRDSWFAGYIGDLLAVAWVGRDDNQPTGLSGASGAMRVWAELMRRLDPRPAGAPVPEGIEYAWIDLENGLRATRDCARAIYLPFSHGSAPRLQSGCGGSPGD